MRRCAKIAALAVAVAATGCRGGSGQARVATAPRTSVEVGAGRPSLLVVEREGDARGALAVAVNTEGIAPQRGAIVAVALGALVEERLAARGIGDAGPVGGWNGWRLKALVVSSADAVALVDAAREAMLKPVAPNDPALRAVARKVEALARRPLPDRALMDVARCTGEAYGIGDETAPSAAELEAWRRAAHGLGRIAIATAGEASLADAVAAALTRAPAWPHATPIAPDPWPAPDARAVVYDASGQLAPGAARVVVTVRTTAPERAVSAAPTLGDPRGPLATRLAALDAPAKVRSVVATAHVDGGCLAVALDLSARDLALDGPARVATAAALARQELAVEMADAPSSPELPRWLAKRASDPREAAERSAWWGLAGRRAGEDELRSTLTVGVAAPRDTSEPVAGAASDSPLRSGEHPVVADAMRAEIDRATVAWHAPVIEAHARVERGQGEAWLLLASTCGTLGEANHDAGTGAAVATAAALQATNGAGDARFEPFVATDGIGMVVHGPARPGELPQAHARRLADLVGRTFAADALDAEHLARARTLLLARAGELDGRALAALGGALAPGHPAWTDPFGTSFGLGSASDEAIALRAAAIRSGPLRVAVLANSESAQVEVAVQAIDRWVARRPGDARSCPPAPTLAAPRPGTYAVELPPKAQSEALLAIPLPVGDEATLVAATWVAAALEGPGGLLARAVGGPIQGDLPGAALARDWSAAVLGAPRSPALVLRLVASDGSLDAAVAQTRALLDRLQKGALREEDRMRSEAAIARSAMAASLDPRARTIELWRAEASSVPNASRAPTLDALRAFASAQLRDDALVIVAARPAHGDLERGSTPRPSKGGGP